MCFIFSTLHGYLPATNHKFVLACLLNRINYLLGYACVYIDSDGMVFYSGVRDI